MKKQIKRLSPHQNGKVFGVLMALGSLVFVIPMTLAFSFMPMPQGQSGPPAFFVMLLPIVYLVMGYLTEAVGCLIYNYAFRFLGGIEYETLDGNTYPDAYSKPTT